MKQVDWSNFISNNADINEIQDELTQFKRIPKKSIDEYPLRSQLRQKIINLGFNFGSMSIALGEWQYFISRTYIAKLIGWLNEEDNAVSVDMTVDNAPIFSDTIGFISDKFYRISVIISEEVWNLLIKTFGGGARIRYRKTFKSGYNIIRVFSADTGPTHCRTFIFSTRMPTFVAKEIICKSFNVRTSLVRWVRFYNYIPDGYVDDHPSRMLGERGISNSKLTYLDKMNPEGQFHIEIYQIRDKFGHLKRYRCLAPRMFPNTPQQPANFFTQYFNEKHKYRDNSFMIQGDSKSKNKVFVAINNEDNINIKVKEEVFAMLKDTIKLSVIYQMAKFILLAVKDTCKEFNMCGPILLNDKFCCLVRFSCLKKVEVSTSVESVGRLEPRLFKALESCATLEEYESSQFLGDNLVGWGGYGFYHFTLEPRITERIRFPFEVSHFFSIKFKVRSLTLLNPEMRITRQLISVLLLINPDKIQFPLRQALHYRPSRALHNASLYTR